MKEYIGLKYALPLSICVKHTCTHTTY